MLTTLVHAVDGEAWMASALCAKVPPSTLDWYPPTATTPEREPVSVKRRREDACKTVCRRCPARNACLAYALDVEADGVNLGGIWGGCDETERAPLLRRRGAA